MQVLFGFLLSLPFTTRFARLSHGQRDLYLASLVLAAVATALLGGPVAYHRLVFRRGQKERLIRAANVMALLGLGTVGLAVSAAVLLVTGYVASGLTAGLIGALVFCSFAGLWFVFPLAPARTGMARTGITGDRNDPLPAPPRSGLSRGVRAATGSW